MARVMFLLLILAVSAHAGRDPFGKSIQLDPGFGYYQDRSKESIASEVRVNGYKCVRLIVTRDSSADAGLVQAFHDQGLAVWCMSFGNGTYSTADLPAGWESWKMKLLDKQANEVAGGFVYLCLNNPEYRAWKKKQVVEALKRVPFDGFEMAESFWPAYKGPESPSYGCLCDACRAAFLKMYPGEKSIPDFKNAEDPNYYKTNTGLYRKWVDFRAKSVLAYHREITSAVRKECPKVKIGVWGIADDVPDPAQTLREWEGIDGRALTAAIQPDMYVIQTDWPDWSNPSLVAEYPLKYKSFVEAVRSAGTETRIIMQADIGSWENCRRGSDWMRKCEQAAIQAGMSGITAYEYHLSSDIYDMPPKPMEASAIGDTIKLSFNKRLDPVGATDIANYSPDSGRVLSAEADGSVVKLKVEGRPKWIIVRSIADDPARRFYKSHPPVVMKHAVVVKVMWH